MVFLLRWHELSVSGRGMVEIMQGHLLPRLINTLLIKNPWIITASAAKEG